MGLFKKLKKAFKKVTGFVKKTIKKTVKVIKKVGKKIKSSKILKALAIAAIVIVTGGAALSAMGATAGAGAFGTAAATGTGFAGWMTGTAASLTSTTLGAALATPFTMLGTAAGKAALFLGVPAISNAAVGSTAQAAAIAGQAGATTATGTQLTTKQILAGQTPASVARASALPSVQGAVPGLNLTATSTLPGVASSAGGLGTLPASAGVAGTAAQQLAVTVPNALGATLKAAPVEASWFARHPKLTAAGAFVGTTVAQGVLGGAINQYIAGDPETQGSMAGAAVEGAEYMDPLKVYAAQQGINTDGIYQHMMYGNQDPSSQYGNDLYRQQTFGVA